MQTRKITEIENDIGAVPVSLIRIYKQSLGIARTVARFEDEVILSIACAIVVRDTPVSEAGGDMETRIRTNDSFASLAAAVALRDAIQAHPDLAEATKVLTPLFLELENAKAQLAAETLAADRAAAERQAAISAATERAMADVAKQFPEPSAPAPAEPAPPFRGKVPRAEPALAEV